MPTPNKLEEAIEFLFEHPDDAEWRPKRETIPLDYVRSWMRSDNIELLGFAHSLLNDRRFRVEPALSVEEYVNFSKHCFERCFRENPDGEWSDSSYSAGWDLCSMFVYLWDREDVPRAILGDLKSWLTKLYFESDAELRKCFVHATLEHLFERRPIMEFFSEWRKDSALKGAFEEAALWGKYGGKTLL